MISSGAFVYVFVFVGVEGDVFDVFCCFRTIERYVSAILVPVEDEPAVVFSSPERTKGTLLRRIPAPKTRWSSNGR